MKGEEKRRGVVPYIIYDIRQEGRMGMKGTSVTELQREIVKPEAVRECPADGDSVAFAVTLPNAKASTNGSKP